MRVCRPHKRTLRISVCHYGDTALFVEQKSRRGHIGCPCKHFRLAESCAWVVMVKRIHFEMYQEGGGDGWLKCSFWETNFLWNVRAVPKTQVKIQLTLWRLRFSSVTYKDSDRTLQRTESFHSYSSSSSSIGTATVVGFGLLNYRWVFSAGRLLQSAIASGTSNTQLGGPVIRRFQLPPP